MICNVCLVDTPYALSIYLLKMSLKDISRTMFFIGDSINTSVANKLPHYVMVRNQSARSDWKYMSWLRFYKYIKCWSIPFANLYVQDHLYIASQIIGPYHYINLPDGPDCYSFWEKCPYQPQKNRPTKIKQMIKHFFSRGKMYDLKYGTNSQCLVRWVTTINDTRSIYLCDRTYEYIDAKQLWINASREKKEFIMHVFGVSNELLELNYDVVILTQPFREDCHLTDEEVYNIFAPYILGRNNVAIKTHPRDKFDWKKYFPTAYVIDTYAPMQILNYIGFSTKEAITVCSSSISAMPDEVNKIVLGTKVNQKIFNIYGDRFN